MVLSKKELLTFFNEQLKIFDIVRLVDVSLTTAYLLSQEGEMVAEPYQCYAVWNKKERCENCISAKAYAIKGQLSKFEFVKDEVYFVISSYSVIEGKEYMIEMVTKLNDDTLFGTYGRSSFIDSIESYNKKLYIDALTGAYNRYYYDEQLSALNRLNAMVLVDIDDFKSINDNCGHLTGDYVLKQVVGTMRDSIRPSDAIVRLGGDEFLLVFRDISKEALIEKLETIKHAITNISVPNSSKLNTSVSMGAIYAINPPLNLFDLADKSLYEAKKHKNCIVFKDIF